jgi:hypothetical protein
MPLSEDQLLLAGILLFAADGLLTHFRPRLAAGWVGVALPAAMAGIVVTLAVATAVRPSWWTLVDAVIIAAGLVVVWDLNRSARTGCPSRILRRRIQRQLARERGRPLQSLAQLRAEYGQTILDDAARDPILAELLDEYAEVIAEEMQEPEGRPGIGSVEALTLYANGFLDSLSQPGRRPQGPAYRGYSREMLTVAAVCRAAERLQARTREMP